MAFEEAAPGARYARPTAHYPSLIHIASVQCMGRAQDVNGGADDPKTCAPPKLRTTAESGS